MGNNDGVKTLLTYVGVTLVFISGLALTVFAWNALKSEGFEDAASVIRADTANGDGLPMDMHSMFVGIFAVGVVTILASFLGCCGVAQSHNTCLAPYVLIAFLCAVYFAGTGWSMLMVYEGMAPTVERQVSEFCNTTNYNQLTAELSCPAHTTQAPAPTSPPAAAATTVRRLASCGNECASRVALLKSIGGSDGACDFLNDACFNKDFDSLGPGFCYVAGGALKPRAWSLTTSSPGTTSLDACMQFCKDDIQCTGVAYQKKETNTMCYVITLGDKPGGSNWIEFNTGSAATAPLISAKDASVSPDDGTWCHVKKESVVVKRLQLFSKAAFAWCSIFSVLMTVSLCCTFSHLYTATTKRTGKKGALAMCYTMFCPCMKTRKKKRMFAPTDEEDEEDEEGMYTENDGL